MVRISDLKCAIREIEGFEVDFLHDGNRVHGNTRIEPYSYTRKAPHNTTASQFISTRMPMEFNTVVLNADGVPVNSRARLYTIRQQYLAKA
jgi:hypothetical protein